jgi:hypothetical protein
LVGEFPEVDLLLAQHACIGLQQVNNFLLIGVVQGSGSPPVDWIYVHFLLNEVLEHFQLAVRTRQVDWSASVVIPQVQVNVLVSYSFQFVHVPLSSTVARQNHSYYFSLVEFALEFHFVLVLLE